MEENAKHDINYYIAIPKKNERDLATIRKWEELNVGIENELIWVTNLTLAQIESVEVKQLPVKFLYYSNQGKLYKLHSLLPDKKEPSLLYTPIQRAFPISLTDLNFNFFGLNQTISIQLVTEEIEKKTCAILVSLEDLESYLNTAPEFRTKNIYWVVINNKEALLFGIPILPINGITYWQISEFLLPTGYNFELFFLSGELLKKLNPLKENWIIWNKDSTYFKIKKDKVKLLSLSSLRKTRIKLDNQEIKKDE